MKTDVTRWRIGLAAGLVGALAAVVLGFLTFGVQSTVAPRGLPLALAVPAGPAGAGLAPVTDRVVAQSGGAVEWRVVDPARAAELLDDAEVYGVLELAPGVDGAVTITTRTSGAVHPAGTLAAEQVLAGAGGALAEVVAQRTGTSPAAVEETVHPATPAARSLPLSATALLWIGALAANAVLLLTARRAGRGYPVPGALTGAATIAVVGPAVVYGFAGLWGLGIGWSWGVWAFLALVAGGFALLQAGLLRLVGLPGIGLLGMLYLSAPAVAGQVPELLHPAYRVLLWSWTPIRFSTEALRSLFFSGGVAPAVTVGAWVFAGLAVAGLAVLLAPSRRRPADTPEPAGTPSPAAVG
ncbi:MAG TPA: ABC transporter permease [Pseudonocardia sp.]|nr:ABC transporter permease [Pseudonocardia sp.]